MYTIVNTSKLHSFNVMKCYVLIYEICVTQPTELYNKNISIW